MSRTRSSASVRRRVMGLRPMRTVRASIILPTVRFSSPPSLARWGASSHAAELAASPGASRPGKAGKACCGVAAGCDAGPDAAAASA